MTKPTLKAINTIRKKYHLSGQRGLSLSQYREACEISQSSNTGKKQSFCFVYNIEEMTENSVTIRIDGNHLSKNRIDSLSFRQKLAYKRAFKQGADELWYRERKRLHGFSTMSKAIIHFTFYTKRSRDHDNNAENIKRTQDTMIRLGLIQDDSRQHLSLGELKEIKSKNMGIKIVIEQDKETS